MELGLQVWSRRQISMLKRRKMILMMELMELLVK
jgi:hypothetical protein